MMLALHMPPQVALAAKIGIASEGLFNLLLQDAVPACPWGTPRRVALAGQCVTWHAGLLLSISDFFIRSF
jgi:hypothetical protein